MTVCVVTEGESDNQFIQSLLKSRKIGPVQLFTSKGSSSAQSLTRSLVGIKQRPVALIIDANEYEPSKVEERRRHIEAMLDTTAPRDQWELILLAPEMEIIFFQLPGLIEALGLPAPTAAQTERAKHQPREVLLDLLSKADGHGSTHWRAWIRKMLPRLPYDEIWRLEPFSQLQRFLERHQHPSETGLPSPR